MYLCNKLCLDASKFSKIFNFFLGTEGLRLIQKPYYDLYYLYLIFRSTQSKASKIEGYNNTSARIVERLPAKKKYRKPSISESVLRSGQAHETTYVTTQNEVLQRKNRQS
jgi:hypothetical protein